MKESFNSSEYRDNLAKDLVETPKEERGDKLAEAKETEDYQFAKEEHRFYIQKKDLITEMVLMDEAANEQEAIELVMEREKEIDDWIANQCSPESLPKFITEFEDGDYTTGSYSLGNMRDRITQTFEGEFEQFLETQKEVDDFIHLLRERGKPVKEAFTYKQYNDSKGELINNYRFQYDSELYSELKNIYEQIKGETAEDTSKKSAPNRKLAALQVAIRKEFPEMAFYNVPEKEFDDMDFTEYSGTGDRDRFNKMFGATYEQWNNGEYENRGAEDKWKRPADFFKIEDNTRFNMSVPSTLEGGYGKRILDLNLILAAKGFEYTEKLFKNFSECGSALLAASREGGREKSIIKLLGKDYSTVKQEMPEALDVLQDENVNIKSVDIDLENKILSYISGRSEYGSSGGIARFSQVKLLHDGKEYQKEFQYRDRYNSSSDNYAYDLRSTEIKSITPDGENLIVKIEAKAGDKYPPVNVEFSVKLEEPKSNFPELNNEQVEAFASHFTSTMEAKLADKMTDWNSRKESGEYFNEHAQAYMKYPQPTISNSVSKEKNGLGAFVTKEAIDHRVRELQVRHELYAVIGDGEPIMIHEDHAYNIIEGDSSIFGLAIEGEELSYSTRNGRRTVNLNQKVK